MEQPMLPLIIQILSGTRINGASKRIRGYYVCNTYSEFSGVRTLRFISPPRVLFSRYSTISTLLADPRTKKISALNISTTRDDSAMGLRRVFYSSKMTLLSLAVALGSMIRTNHFSTSNRNHRETVPSRKSHLFRLYVHLHFSIYSSEYLDPRYAQRSLSFKGYGGSLDNHTQLVIGHGSTILNSTYQGGEKKPGVSQGFLEPYIYENCLCIMDWSSYAVRAHGDRLDGVCVGNLGDTRPFALHMHGRGGYGDSCIRRSRKVGRVMLAAAGNCWEAKMMQGVVYPILIRRMGRKDVNKSEDGWDL
ncbi:hypothetical protein PM082_020649 [Marasmius tenuissimus]|nr:hypothetical protein PM082_020649 [Marasmius tenuissimus]